jgi:CIC family chloride channel protein
MAACVVSTLVSQLLNKDSIYTTKLVRQGIDIFKREDPNVLKGLFVRDIIDEEPEVIPASANFRTLLDLVVQSSHSQYFVLNAGGALLGTIALSEVRRLIYEQDALQHLVVAGDLVVTSGPAVTLDDNLDVAMHLFASSGVDELAVVDAEHPTKLLGTVHEQDVIEVRNRESMRRDLAGGLSSHVDAAEKGQTIDLGDGFALREFAPSHRLLGRSLREVAVRERTGVQVLLIRRAHSRIGDRSAVRVPTADDLIEEGDTLVVAGSSDGLKQLEQL